MKRLILSFTIVMLMSSVAQANIIYVNASIASTGNGQSWTTPYKTLLEGIDNSVAGDSLFVADGSYYPSNTTNTTLQFLVNHELHLFGGFPNSGIPSWTNRNWQAGGTIIEGDIAGNDAQNIRTDNALRLISFTDIFVIDGFLLQNGGNAGGGVAAGLVSHGQTGVIKNCTFQLNLVLNSSNVFVGRGGAIYATTNGCFETDVLEIENCFFNGNGAEEGGAIYTNRSMNIKKCKFVKNMGNDGPGAYFSTIHDDDKDEIKINIEQCVFYQNDFSQAGPVFKLESKRSGSDGSVIDFKIDFCSFINEYSILEVQLNNPSSTINSINLFADNNIIELDSNLHSLDLFTVDFNAPPQGLNYTTNNRNQMNYASSTTGGWYLGTPNWATYDTVNAVFVMDCNSTGIDSAATTTITTDIAGNSRLDGTNADLGAFESQCNAIPNSVRDHSLANQIKLFPNPTFNVLNFDLGGLQSTKAEILDMTGKRVKAFQPNQSTEVGNLPEGIYILRLFTNQGVVHKRFVKQ